MSKAQVEEAILPLPTATSLPPHTGLQYFHLSAPKHSHNEQASLKIAVTFSLVTPPPLSLSEGQ